MAMAFYLQVTMASSQVADVIGLIGASFGSLIVRTPTASRWVWKGVVDDLFADQRH